VLRFDNNDDEVTTGDVMREASVIVQPEVRACARSVHVRDRSIDR
jgi:hypothetical protein